VDTCEQIANLSSTDTANFLNIWADLSYKYLSCPMELVD